jgi:uncharacterized membrane-anchored protein
MQTGHWQKAYKIAPTSLSVSLKTLREWAKGDHRRKSLQAIKKIWAMTPHPDLLDYWIKHAPKKAQGNGLAMAAWVEDLYHIAPEAPYASLYIAETLIRLGQKEQASRFAKMAIESCSTYRTYRLMNQIDPLGGWASRMGEALPDALWVCEKTGRTYDEWQAVTKEGHFNTLYWGIYDSQGEQQSTSGKGDIFPLLRSF